MRSMEDKEVTSNGTTINFEFHKGSGSNRAVSSHHHQHHPHRTPLGKPAPSKWDDAQKWLVGLSRGGHEKGVSKSKPRNSNADDTRLIAPTPQLETDFSSPGEEEVEKAENMGCVSSNSMARYEVETKKVDCEESFWCVNKSIMATEYGSLGVRSVCLRDMGTEMTPAASQEPSRTATPIRAATPVGPRSPITSGSATPIRCQHAGQSFDDHEAGVLTIDPKASPLARGNSATTQSGGTGEMPRPLISNHVTENRNVEHTKKMTPLEMRAMAWDEAERAKYMARYKQEEVKIQAWENHQKRKAEMQMKKTEVKAERMKARAQEKYANKLASTRRIAEEKRGNAEAKLNEKAVRTSEKADYIRRTGHLPPSFSFKFPSCCCFG